MLSRIRGRGWGFRGGHRMDQLLFPLPLACSSATWAERQRRGGERQIRFAPRYPRAVRRGLTTGSFSKTRPAPNAAAAPNRRGTLLRNASPNLTPKRVRFGQQRLFLPPCTAHSFSARRKRMGGAKPRSSSHFRHPDGCNPPSRQYDSRPRWGRQSCRFLETGSLFPPLAALRLFPPFSLGLAQRLRPQACIGGQPPVRAALRPERNGPCTVQKKGAFSPLYTKADGRFLRRCRTKRVSFPPLRRRLFFARAKKSGGRKPALLSASRGDPASHRPSPGPPALLQRNIRYKI